MKFICNSVTNIQAVKWKVLTVVANYPLGGFQNSKQLKIIIKIKALLKSNCDFEGTVSTQASEDTTAALEDINKKYPLPTSMLSL